MVFSSQVQAISMIEILFMCRNGQVFYNYTRLREFLNIHLKLIALQLFLEINRYEKSQDIPASSSLRRRIRIAASGRLMPGRHGN